MIQGLCDSIQPAFSFFLSLPIKSCHSELRIVILSEAKNLLFQPAMSSLNFSRSMLPPETIATIGP
jgi:hypothetical protein